MTNTRRAGRLAAALMAVSLLGACGGGGSDDGPTIKPTSDSPASSAAPADPDGFSPDQRAAADAVVAYFTAVLERGTAPIGPAVKGLVTQKVLDGLVPAETDNVEKKGLQYIGKAKIDPTKVTIKGDKATVEGCNDSSGVFLVKKGEKTAGVGSTVLGISRMDVELVRQDGTWLVDVPRIKQASSC